MNQYHLIIFLLLVLPKLIFGQINVETFPPGGVPVIFNNYVASSASFIPPHDAGTGYAYHDASTNGDYYIYRVSGIWYLGLANFSPYPPANGILGKTINVFTSINPPCKALWTRTSTNGTPYGTPSKAVFTGASCMLPTSNFTSSLHTDQIKLPSLSSTEIQNITPVGSAVITFNNSTDRIQMHDGYEWNDLISQRGNDTIHTDLTIQKNLNMYRYGVIKYTAASHITANPPIHPNITTGSNSIIIRGDDKGAAINRGLEVIEDGGSHLGYIGSNYNSYAAINMHGSLSINKSTFGGGPSVLNYDLTNDLASGGSAIYYYDQSHNITVDLPNPNSIPDRVYFFTNYGTGSITFNYPIKTGVSSTKTVLASGERITIQAVYINTGGYYYQLF